MIYIKTNIDEIVKKLEENNQVIPATNDHIFKALFQDSEMRSLLSFIISEVTGINKDYVFEHMCFRNTELPKKNAFNKTNVTDLLVDIENMTISLEMNDENGIDTYFRNSAHFHSLIVNSFDISDTYKDAGIVIQINFDNKHPFTKELISEIMLMDVLTGKVDEPNYKKYRINLSKAREKDYNNSKLTKFERILLVMQEKNKDKLQKFAGKDEEIVKMADKIVKMSRNKKYVSLYDEEKLYRLSLSIAEKEMKKEATRKGLEEGMRQGIEQGIEQNKCDMVKKMHDNNISIEVISNITGFSNEEIEKLIN